jgi:hypothetical protein
LLGINDVFNLVDSLSMGREGMSADSFTLSDVVNVSLGTSSGILVSDQMNLSDNLNNVVTNTFDSDYYRRYLGDVRYGSN